MLESVYRDVRFGLRVLSRSPAFAAVAIVSLAIGIGADTSVFTVLRAVLLRELPVPRPGELVLVRKLVDGSTWNPFSYPAFLSMQRNQSVLQGLLASGDLPLRTVELGSGTQAGRAVARSVTRNYFAVLGISARVGRVFGDGDTDPSVVVSDRFWGRQFGRSASMLGSVLVLNGVSTTIIGILPPEFFGENPGQNPDIYVPMDLVSRIVSPNYVQNDRNHWVSALGRLRPGVSIRDAEGALDNAFQQTSEYRRSRTANRELRVVAEPGSRGLRAFRDRFDKPILVLMCLAGLLLLIACCNVANLLLSRATARRREMGIRIAVGGAGGRIVRQLMTESLLLSAAGGVIALWVAHVTAPALIALASDPANPVFIDVRLDWTVFSFALATSLITTLLFGLIPAVQILRLDVSSELKSGSGGQGRASTKQLAGKVLIVIQVALSLVLLIGAGLFLRTLSNLNSIDPGFRPGNVVVGQLNFEPSRAGLEHLAAIGPLLLERLAALPGVEACALSTYGGMTRGHETTSASLPERQGPPGAPFRVNYVSTGYFRTYGIDLVAGRGFQDIDNAGAPQVTVINQSTARRLFHGANPVGHRVSLTEVFDPKQSLEVVGIARDSKYTDLREEMPAQLYVPLAQTRNAGIFAAVRTSGAPSSIVAFMREAVRQVDSRTSFGQVRTLQENMQSTLVQERMMARLSTGFAVVSLVLACVGVYGVISYAMARRVREMGIRLAAGASPRALVGMLLRDAVVLLGSGIVLGAAAAMATMRYLASLLFGLTPWDPVIFVTMTAFLSAAVLLAAYVPARRAARIDPMAALRME